MTVRDKRIAVRLWHRDTSLWGGDANEQASIAQRLGWLDSPQWLCDNAADLGRWAAGVKAQGFERAVLVGMGGSSLAAEVLSQALGPTPSGLPVLVADNTHPLAVRGLEQQGNLAKTLFIVASKSGHTAEVTALSAYFWDAVCKARGDAGAQFIAITDPGTPLEKLARQRGYRDCFLNPPDVGGRFAALTAFAMVPAALLGLDLSDLAGRASTMATRCRGDQLVDNPGLALGLWLGEQWQAGRGQLQLRLSPGIAPLGAWIEQLVAESTGKQGKGLLPLLAPASSERAAGAHGAWLAVGSARDGALWQQCDQVEKVGTPVLRLLVEDPRDLAGEFFRWEFAIATAGAVMGLNPFNEPDVNASKEATRKLLSPSKAPSAPVAGSLAELGASLRAAPAGSYLAVLAFLPADREAMARLQGLAGELGDYLNLPVTVNVGPRYLHSSGQLHKGGPQKGHFLVVTATTGWDLAIPGEAYSFAELNVAQAAGDFAVLAATGQPVFRLALDGDPAGWVDSLSDQLRAALLA